MKTTPVTVTHSFSSFRKETQSNKRVCMHACVQLDTMAHPNVGFGADSVSRVEVNHLWGTIGKCGELL